MDLKVPKVSHKISKEKTVQELGLLAILKIKFVMILKYLQDLWPNSKLIKKGRLISKMLIYVEIPAELDCKTKMKVQKRDLKVQKRDLEMNNKNFSLIVYNRLKDRELLWFHQNLIELSKILEIFNQIGK